ncbi:hypothetical protein GCM10011390_39320 [Aureimonas endophytica]|jgi:uncharacterized protein (DUF305 family)|uniref:DUF305 domain-containing protein n=2 Tax=Aureimonas TaxID=414371 RepID=A0A917E919_9HYPH|nr:MULTISPECIES: DUF305 domain-containing protein [Aureimonas]RIX99144.1 DUF305 domain-containing protein [Aureimonas flava]GGE16395.1 hypothetical protein GCM10011390_39320 [Aureimonas endophytica]
MRKITILSAALLAAAVSHASAQDQHGMAASSEQVTLPAACEAAAGSMDMSKMMGGMEGMMSGGQMDEVQKGNMDAMMKMHGPMMKAAMIKDPDLAFNCGMIAHHQGAIAMSEVELKTGKDEKSKEMARMIIDAQKKEIEEMTARVEALAK